jgi:hypothetical protein
MFSRRHYQAVATIIRDLAISEAEHSLDAIDVMFTLRFELNDPYGRGGKLGAAHTLNLLRKSRSRWLA